MSFFWQNQYNEDCFKTISSMIKYNNGAWKSTKQRDYLTAKQFPFADFAYPRDIENASKYYNVTMVDGQYGFILEGETRWADYGRKSYRRVGWFFVMDDIGVVAKYKLHYSYDDKHGSSCININRTDCEWTRPEGVSAPVAPEPEVKPETKHFGEIGQRYTALLKEVAYIDRGIGMFGNECLTIWKDEDGNTFYYNNCMSKIDKETCESGIMVSFKVKKHIINKKGDKATVVSRMMLTKEQKLINVMKG